MDWQITLVSVPTSWGLPILENRIVSLTLGSRLLCQRFSDFKDVLVENRRELIDIGRPPGNFAYLEA